MVYKSNHKLNFIPSCLHKNIALVIVPYISWITNFPLYELFPTNIQTVLPYKEKRNVFLSKYNASEVLFH